jgi:carbon storage regulator
MLLLTRREKECILVGDDIRVTIVRVQHDKVRIGVEAPKGVVVQRQERPTGEASPPLDME